MRIDDAPPAGWYPDPEGGSRLRWWEGTDWADRWRAPPTRSEVDRRALVQSTRAEEDHEVRLEDYQDRFMSDARMGRRETQSVVDQVRLAAREEAERTSQMLQAQARAVTREIQPLITQYTSTFTRWFRRVAVLVILVLIAWVAVQIFAQASLFDWIGDRIDNLTDDTGATLNPFL